MGAVELHMGRFPLILTGLLSHDVARLLVTDPLCSRSAGWWVELCALVVLWRSALLWTACLAAMICAATHVVRAGTPLRVAAMLVLGASMIRMAGGRVGMMKAGGRISAARHSPQPSASIALPHNPTVVHVRGPPQLTSKPKFQLTFSGKRKRRTFTTCVDDLTIGDAHWPTV